MGLLVDYWEYCSYAKKTDTTTPEGNRGNNTNSLLLSREVSFQGQEEIKRGYNEVSQCECKMYYLL
jgi:hypothetical protein